jgi:hypothetical protein
MTPSAIRRAPAAAPDLDSAAVAPVGQVGPGSYAAAVLNEARTEFGITLSPDAPPAGDDGAA